MKKDNKTAILLGATGLVGGTLLELLLRDSRYHKIVLFSRRSIAKEDPKLEEHICDVLELESQKSYFKGDEVFCCVGTTNAKTPDKALYKKVDYGIPLAASNLCVQNQIPSLLVVSALGADASSAIFYNRVKGMMEKDVLKTSIPKIHILQPSMIGGHRKEKRPGEYIFKKLMLVFGFLMLGPFQKYRVIHPQTIAKAMLWLANSTFAKNRIDSQELKTLSQNG